MGANQTILAAVKRDDAASIPGIQQRMFAKWFDAFVYNQIWEDPRVDLKALELGHESRVLTISSGGCNALNYLLAGPESVTAVDLNRHHIFLLNLKAAAARHPLYDDFFELFGFGLSARAIEIYRRHLAPALDDSTREFWEARRLFRGRRIDFFTKGGLYRHSRNAYFLRVFHWLSRRLGLDIEKVLYARSIEEQEMAFASEIAPFFESRLIKMIGKMPVTLFGLGIPPQQHEELKRDLVHGSTIIDVYRERVRRLACGFPINDNYFAWQAFGLRYDTVNRTAVPDYLKRENFERLRGNIGRLSTTIASVTEEIRQSPRGTFNRFVFLDAQDWMNAAAITELWSLIADRAEPDSRIIFRTAGSVSPIETSLPAGLRNQFVYEKDRSEDLFRHDRASIYGGFHLYRLKA